jgi:spermidine synthase
MPRSRALAETPLSVPVYVFATVSAVAALVYQVAWTRMLSLTFGRTTLATSAVVAGFMGGMGIGAWLYHRIERGRPHDALRVYAGLEVGIAISAALLTAGFAPLPGIFASVAADLPAGPGLDLLRIALVIAMLLVPAALMGATFPALCSVLIRSRAGVARHLGRVYGLNTVGAAAGALLGGFVWVEALGLRGSVRAAIAINLAIGALAWWLARSGVATPDERAALSDDDARLPSRLPHALTAAVLFGSGFATLAYEILWFRALQYLFGNSTYALSAMLVVFLLGLGIGGLLFGRVVRRERPERDLALCQLGVAVFAVLAIAGLAAVLGNDRLAGAVSIFSPSVVELPWWRRIAGGCALALALMLPATLGMGLSFPLASRLYLADVRQLGRRVGTSVLLANLGSILGSVLAAVAILPRLGTVGGTRAVAALNLALGLAVLAALGGPRRPRLLLGGVAALASLGTGALLPPRLAFQGEQAMAQIEGQLLWQEEGDLATVQVWASSARSQIRAMTIDGTAIAVSRGWFYPVYSKQLLLAHLPLALDPRIRSSLSVGLGSGSTLHALASYPSLRSLDAVEISAAVARASRFFAESEALADPRAHLVVDDVMHFLRRSPQRYDLIVSDGKQNADFSSNWTMLCLDFYRAARERLSEDGLLVQWIPLTTLPDDFRVVLRTFTRAFPHVQAFLDAPHSLFLVGSGAPIAGRGGWTPGHWERLPAARDLEGFRIRGIEALLARWVADGHGLAGVVGEGPVSSWDHSPLEFSAYRSRPEAKAGAVRENLALLLDAEARSREREAPRFFRPDSPHARSAALLRRAHLADLRGERAEAGRLVQAAAQANPADARAEQLLRGLEAGGD